MTRRGSAASKDTESATPLRRACSVRASRYASPSAARTFGCVRPATRYCGRPGRSVQRTHRLDHPLDALSRAQQAPGQHGRSDSDASRQGLLGTVAPCGIVVTLRRSMSNPTTQPVAGRLGHDDHLIRPRRDLLEHRTLVRRWVFEDRVGDDDRRDPQPVDDVHHLVTVDTAVDAVLMLDDGDVALVE